MKAKKKVLNIHKSLVEKIAEKKLNCEISTHVA